MLGQRAGGPEGPVGRPGVRHRQTHGQDTDVGGKIPSRRVRGHGVAVRHPRQLLLTKANIRPNKTSFFFNSITINTLENAQQIVTLVDDNRTPFSTQLGWRHSSII